MIKKNSLQEIEVKRQILIKKTQLRINFNNETNIKCIEIERLKRERDALLKIIIEESKNLKW